MYYTVKPPIKDTPKEDKPPTKGQAESIVYRKSPLKEDNLSTKDKTSGPESVPIKRFHCIYNNARILAYSISGGTSDIFAGILPCDNI